MGLQNSSEGINLAVEKTESQKDLNASNSAVALILVSVLSSIVMFVLSVALARMLGHEEFHKYIVAVAAISLLGTFCEFGVGKYALKVLPEYNKLEKWGLAAGFWRFCLKTVLGLSVAVMLVVIGLEIGHDGQFGDYLLGLPSCSCQRQPWWRWFRNS